MNIVYYLSDPLDLSPVYDKPIPIEMIDFHTSAEHSITKTCFFVDIFSQMYEYLSDVEFMAIDRGEKPVFYETVEDMDVLNLPSRNLFANIFLYSTFVVSQNMDPVALFYPANIKIEPFELFSKTIRGIIKDNFLNSGFTFFTCAQSGGAVNAIAPGQILHKERKTEFLEINRFISLPEAYEMKEDNKPVLYNTNIFSFNCVKFMEFLSRFDPDLESLFFLVVDAWKDPVSIQTVMRDIIGRLEEEDFYQFINEFEDKTTVELDFNYQSLFQLKDLLTIMPVDEERNYFSGLIHTKDVYDSIIINKGINEIRVENLSSVCGLAKDDEVRIFRI